MEKHLQIKTFLKLLRNFGHLIKDLEFCYWVKNPKVYVGIETYLSKYCSDSVQRLILICSRSKTPFENLQKPLKKVIAVTIFTAADESPNQIRFINDNNLPNVQHIHIFNNYRDQELNDSGGIHFENVEYFTMHTHQIKTYPFSFGNLKHFTIYGNVELNDAFCECISKIQHLKTLKIMSHLSVSIESFSKMLKLQNVVSNVEEMQFEFDDSITPDLILQFLKQSQCLQKLSIHLNMISDCTTIYKYSYLLQTIPSSLHDDDEWKSEIKDPYKNPYSSTIFPHKCLVIEKKIR